MHRSTSTLLAAAIALALSNASVHADASPLDLDPTTVPDDAGEPERAPHQVEAVEVTAAVGTATDSPDALAMTVIRAEDSIAAPSDVQDLVTRVPGVGSTGQNGLFETFSIRGSGANNIQTLFAGMPLTAQRRAGVPVSFLEPALLGEIAITRGPAVVHYGPGALGGAVSVEPRWFDAPYLGAGYASGGDESVVIAATGGESFSIGAARHHANDTESADGTPLHTQFERASAVLQYRASIGAFELDAMLALSDTEDIGKSNSRFPARDTIYPFDRHQLARVRLRHEGGFVASVRAHDQALRTWNRRPGFADTFAQVESRDLGATVQHTFGTGAFTHNVGFEYLGRRGVDAFDATGTLANRNDTLRDAREDGWSLFAISDWDLSETLALEFGARHSGIEQEQATAEIEDDDTGYTAGAVWRPAEAHRLSANLSSGYRYATLEERYFTGVTAQGEVVGNPDLSSERSLGLDLGHAWVGADWRTEVHVFRTEVDDLIQLTDLGPDLNGFANVGEARLYGIEGAVDWTPTDAFALRAAGTAIESEDEGTGEPLYGTPPLITELEARYRFGDFELGARWSHRWRMDEPGFEELERDAVDVVDAELSWRVTRSLTTRLYVQNLFDEDYFATADELSALAPERSIGMRVVWSPE